MTLTKIPGDKSLANRIKSMLKVDRRRMFCTPTFYVMLGIAFAMPILVLVMTNMAGGTTITDPTTGAVSTINPFTNTWQIIGQLSSTGMAMDMTAMCNINLMYMLAGIFICLFISQDFSSGYVKNLFTVRARKDDYVVSKTIIGFIAGALFLIAFFCGAVFGGSFAGLSFDLTGAGVSGLVLCMLAKIFLMAVFIAIFVLMSVIGKNRAWMSILLALFAGMLLFMMIPMMTPLDSGFINVFLCLFGGIIFAAGIGIGSKKVLEKTNLI